MFTASSAVFVRQAGDARYHIAWRDTHRVAYTSCGDLHPIPDAAYLPFAYACMALSYLCVGGNIHIVWRRTHDIASHDITVKTDATAPTLRRCLAAWNLQRISVEFTVIDSASTVINAYITVTTLQ
jgi:hypothetical protein